MKKLVLILLFIPFVSFGQIKFSMDFYFLREFIIEILIPLAFFLIITILFFRFLNKKNLKLNESTYYVLFLASFVGLGFQFSLNPLTEYHFSSAGYFEDGYWKGWDEVRGLVISMILSPLIMLILGSSLCYIFNRKNISKSINKYIIYIAIFLMISQIYSCIS